MATQIERDFEFVFRDSNGDLIIMYPKTIPDQVIAGRGTMQDHIRSDSHLLSTERNALINAQRPNGYLLLGEDGYIPVEHLNESIRSIEAEFSDIDDMLANGAYVVHGALAMVLDATKDPTVNSQWAVYRRDSQSEDYWDLAKGWKKVLEKESIDMDMSFERLPGKPNASAEQIDDVVRLKHLHADKGLLDDFAEDTNGHITYRGEKVAYDDEVKRVVVSDYIDDNVRNYDIWFKPVFGQSWWDDPPNDAGDTCYRAYIGQTFTTAPKLGTSNSTNFIEMFYQCYNLEVTQQYDTSNGIDFSRMYQECSSLETVPYMGETGTAKGVTFDHMFNKCSMLRYSPEMNLVRAQSVYGMYAGCVNMERVLPFGSTARISNMREWFNGCASLVKIMGEIDFSGITSTDKVENMFNECDSLEYVKFTPNTLQVSLSLADTNLSKECIINILQGLPSNTGTGIVKYLNLSGVDAVSEVAQSYIDIAAAKGWQIITN